MLGVAAQVVLDPLGNGPVGREEIEDNLGIAVGGVFYDGDANGGPLLSIDYYKLLWRSTGFGERVGVSATVPSRSTTAAKVHSSSGHGHSRGRTDARVDYVTLQDNICLLSRYHV